MSKIATLLVISTFLAQYAECATIRKSALKNYPYREQPELDAVKLDAYMAYLKKDILFNFQIKCLLYDKPCDAVGRWLVARIPYILLNECPKCTALQKENMRSVFKYIQSEKPDFYQALWDKYIEEDPEQPPTLTLTEDSTSPSSVLLDPTPNISDVVKISL